MFLHHLSFVWGKIPHKDQNAWNSNDIVNEKNISSLFLAHQHLIKTSAITHWSSLRSTLQGTLVTHFSINHCTPQEFYIWMDTAGTGLIRLPVWSAPPPPPLWDSGWNLKKHQLNGPVRSFKIHCHTLVHFILVQDFVKPRKLCKSFWYIAFQRNTRPVVAKTLQLFVW